MMFLLCFFFYYYLFIYFFFIFYIGGCDILFATEKYYNLLLHCNLRLSISSFLICRLKVCIEVLSLILPSFIILLKTMGPWGLPVSFPLMMVDYSVPIVLLFSVLIGFFW